MFGTQTPIHLLDKQLSTLLALMHGVRDGSVEATHDARVETRRIRETLFAARPAFDEDELAGIAHAVGRTRRALARVRDTDVILELLSGLESRLPLAATAAARVRASLAADQQRNR